MTHEEIDGKTPNGVKAVIYYQDDEGSPAEKEDATRAEVVEFDADGKEVSRTYLVLEK